MESILKDDIFEFQSDTLKVVRKQYGLDHPGAMDEAIDILHDWIQKQNHFTIKEFKREYLERVIITTKGSVERAKARLDKLFTLRTLLPIFFKSYNPKIDFKSFKDVVTWSTLPKMTKEHDRIVVTTTVGKKFSSKLFFDVYRYSLLFSEYQRAHDYASGYHCIFDYRNASMPELLANADLSQFNQMITIHMEGYGVRVKGVHVLIDSKFVEVAISIAKQMVSEKIYKRIHCHRTVETLWDHLPKSILPKDYGGDEKSIKDIHADWMKILCSEEYKEYWNEMIMAKTDESLRQTDRFNDQYLGMPGTFRTLRVD